MQEVQRFNKVLKSFVLLGDIILLNLLLWMFTSIWENRSLFEYSMPLLQNMALMTLCYLVCNIRSGVILHRPVVRPEQIMLRVARNMIPFVLIVFGLSYIFHFECVNLRQLGVFYIVLIIVIISYRLTFRSILELYRKSGENVRKVVFVEKRRSFGRWKDVCNVTSGILSIGRFFWIYISCIKLCIT